jgi:hypothetical protein
MAAIMSHKDYCSKVCKAKCCKAYDGFEDVQTCPKLTGQNLCGMYKERFEQHKPYSFFVILNNKGYEAKCGYIENMLSSPNFPYWIRKQCCYAHPELLEIKENDQS